MPVPKKSFIPLLMWLFPLMFFSYQFILRLWPGLMMESIMTQFSIDASGFGILAACYYYGYAGMQIPVALFLEKFSTRWVIFLFATLCGLAMLVFTRTDSFALAILSRFLIGAGSAVGFLGVSRVITDWFPKEKYATMIGFSFTIGLSGAIFGGKPVSMMISHYGWENIALILSALAIIIGLGCLLIIRKPKASQHSQTRQQISLADFKSLFTSRYIWLLALVNLLMVGSLEGFADVWGIPFLMTTLNMPKEQAAWLISFIFLGMLVGGPLLASFSRKWGNYSVITACGLGITLIFSALLINNISSYWLLGSLFFITGILCCYQVLVFSAGSDMVAERYLGVTVAFLNCINMLGGSFFHTFIGCIMDNFWQGNMLDGVRIYDVISFQLALGIIPLAALTGCLVTLYIARKMQKPSGDYLCQKN